MATLAVSGGRRELNDNDEVSSDNSADGRQSNKRGRSRTTCPVCKDGKLRLKGDFILKHWNKHHPNLPRPHRLPTVRPLPPGQRVISFASAIPFASSAASGTPTAHETTPSGGRGGECLDHVADLEEETPASASARGIFRDLSSLPLVHADEISVAVTNAVRVALAEYGVATSAEVLRVVRENIALLPVNPTTGPDAPDPISTRTRNPNASSIKEAVIALGFKFRKDGEGSDLPQVYCVACEEGGARAEFRTDKPFANLRKSLRAHLITSKHIAAEAAIRSTTGVVKASNRIGLNLSRLVLQTIKEGGSYLDYERKVFDLHLNGGETGRFHHNKRFISDLVPCMYRVCMNRIRTYLDIPDVTTGKSRIFAITADKVTEQHRTGQTVGLLIFDEGEVKAVFADYLLSLDNSGLGMGEQLSKGCVFGTLGLTPDKALQQFVGFAADGQYFNNNVVEHMVQSFKKQDVDVQDMVEWIMPSWDPAHRLELVIGDARKDAEGVGVALPTIGWYSLISVAISDIYTKFAYGKGYEELRKIAEENDLQFYALKRFCDTRFAQAEHKVYINFMHNFPTLVKVVHDRSVDKALSQGERDQSSRWLSDHLYNFEWVGTLLFVIALLDKCKFLSLEMQTVNVLPWELAESQKQFHKDMKRMHVELTVSAVTSCCPKSGTNFPTLPAGWSAVTGAFPVSIRAL